ncbi:MAG: hypothetical protein ACTSPV_20000, partial [Candidatus Hodarchaeales archaeon]
KPVWVLSSQKKIIQKGGKRGRPKGSKNRVKTENDVSPLISVQNNSQRQRPSAQKRGPKNVFTDGYVVEIRVNPHQKTIEVMAPIIDPSNPGPSLDIAYDPLQVLSLLYPVFHEFKCQYISSNRIENLFSQLDYLFIPRGRRTVTSVTNETSTWLLLHKSFSLLSSVVYYTANSFSSRTGLFNLGKLLVPIDVSPT